MQPRIRANKRGHHFVWPAICCSRGFVRALGFRITLHATPVGSWGPWAFAEPFVQSSVVASCTLFPFVEVRNARRGSQNLRASNLVAPQSADPTYLALIRRSMQINSRYPLQKTQRLNKLERKCRVIYAWSSFFLVVGIFLASTVLWYHVQNGPCTQWLHAPQRGACGSSHHDNSLQRHDSLLLAVTWTAIGFKITVMRSLVVFW